MPTTETLERFIALVEQNAHIEAVETFYTPDASMQENQSPPRVGRDAHVANERRVMAKGGFDRRIDPLSRATPRRRIAALN